MTTMRRHPLLDTFGGQILNLAGLMLVVVAIPALMVYETWSEQVQLRRAWDIAGPACPVVENTASVFGAKGPKTFEYGAIRFDRRYGHVSCVAPPERGMVSDSVYRVCQFSAPAALAVTSEGRTITYKPGAGRRATVTVRDGEVGCVVGGWFKG